jgi:hypothetical protein
MMMIYADDADADAADVMYNDAVCDDLQITRFKPISGSDDGFVFSKQTKRLCFCFCPMSLSVAPQMGDVPKVQHPTC